MLTSSHIGIGSHVRVRDQDGEDEFTIVGPEDSDFMRGLISGDSPLAAALIGHSLGDSVYVMAPGGLRPVTIVSVS